MERFAIKIDKNLKTHLYKICRLCGIDNPDKIKILDDEILVNLEDGEPELWKKVLDCIGLLITKDDKMPQFMCTLCVDKINDFFEFREMCYATDGQTRKLLGIKEEAKLKVQTTIGASSLECKTEDQDIKLPVSQLSSTQRSGRKRRNADMDICNASLDIKTDLSPDVKIVATNIGTSATKKKRLKLDSTETETKPELDIKAGPSAKAGLSSKLGKQGVSSKLAATSKLGLSKKRLKIEPLTKEKKEFKPAKISKFTRNKFKAESPPLSEVPTDGRKPSLQIIQKKKKTLELLKQRKLGKKGSVIKVEKVRKGSTDSKIKEETTPVPAAAPTPTQPKVKLKDICTICSESFVNKSLLDKHIKVTHIPTVVRYHCVLCNETLKKNMEIKNHNLWHKLSKTPFQCGNCSESSCSIYTYSKHIRDCSQVAYLDAHIPDWHCPECSGVFETTYLFNIHSCVSTKLVCPGCDRSLKWKEDYMKHIPLCAAAVHRIPEYMSSNIQVKNEAEQPTSPIPAHHTLAPSTSLQATPSSRVTPPLMDSNQCVVIPGNVALHEEASSPTPKGKKNKRITKKDLKRFDKLLKSTMTTLVSIKHEPPQGEVAVADALGKDDEEEQPDSPDVGEINQSQPGSPAPADDDFQQNTDDDDSADEPGSSSQPVGTIKQEIIDEGYRDLYNNIEVNIKREVVLLDKRNDGVTTPKKKLNDGDEETTAPKPVLKLKITKEHGTLNSVLVDSPKSEKKKKKKKRKEDKHKAADSRYELNAAEVTTNTSKIPAEPSKIADVLDVAEPVEQTEEEPPMPLPEIVCIKQEITEQELASAGVPSIVAATSGLLQIACVSEGVHFNGAEENDEQNDAEDEEPAAYVEPEDELDVKPRLEDLVPMLQIVSVSSGEDLLKKIVKAPVKRKHRTTCMKPSTSTPQIVSVASGNAALAYQPELEEPSKDLDEDEDSCEKVDNNENIFDYTQVKIKEEVVDPTYEEEDNELPEVEEDNVEQLANDDRHTNSPISDKQAEEAAYIANIDFSNLNIKQEKEYIDDGMDNARAFDDDDSSDSDSESSTDTENNDSESEREYRDLPDNENDLNTNTAPMGLQIAAVRSQFSCPLNKKTESNQDAQMSAENNQKISNLTTETKKLAVDDIALKKDQNFDMSVSLISSNFENYEEYSKHKICQGAKSIPEGASQPSTSKAIEDKTRVADEGQTPVTVSNDLDMQTRDKCPPDLSPTPSNALVTTSDAKAKLCSPEKTFHEEVNQPADDFTSRDRGNLISLSLPSQSYTSGVSENLDVLCSTILMGDPEIQPSTSAITESLCSTVSSSNVHIGENSKSLEFAYNLDQQLNPITTDSSSSKNVTNANSSCLTSVDDITQCDTHSVANIASPSNKTSAIETKVPSDTNKLEEVRGYTLPDEYTTGTSSGLNDLNEFIGQATTLSSITGITETTDITQITDQVVPSTSDQYDDGDITMAEVHPVVSKIDDDTSTLMQDIDDFTMTDAKSSRKCENTQQANICLSSPVQTEVTSNIPKALALPEEYNNQLLKLDVVSQTNEVAQQTMLPPPARDSPQCSPVLSIDHRDDLLQIQSSVTTSTHNDPSYSSYLTDANRFVPTNAELSTSTEFQVDLPTSTAGELHLLTTAPNIHQPLSSSNADLSRSPVLSEEVQNMLNEDTAATNNFELNDSILRAQCSTYPQSPAVAVSVTNFADFENVNEIAENNNNANIERELQDELGNVLAAAIADRSSNDEIDENNVMNENRANFDIA